MRMELSGCNYSYRYYSLDTFCSLQKAVGRETILLYAISPQIWIDDTSTSDPQAINDCLYRYGLKADFLELPSYGYRLGYPLQQMRSVSMNYYKNGVDFCKHVQANNLLISIDPVFLGDRELNGHIYQDSFFDLERYAADNGVRLIVKCSDDSIDAIMNLLSSSDQSPSYALDTFDQERSFSRIFSLYGSAETVLLREPVHAVEHHIEELNQLQFPRSVVYQIYKAPPQSSCPPDKSVPFQFDLMLQNRIRLMKG